MPHDRGVRRARRAAVIAAGVVLALAAGACSSDAKSSSGPVGTTSPSTTIARPDGPAATFAGPVTGGKGIFLGASTPAEPALQAAGYEEAEYTSSGTATSYTSSGDLPTDGTWSLQPGDTADYVTRIVVRRPSDPAKFNGTVAVEWLNVSGGVDAAPDFTYLQDELLRKGYAWVGVSAQRIGVEGGPVAVAVPGTEGQGVGTGLKGIDPARYSSLHHPGDAYAFDMYTQVARALRDPGAVDPLDGLQVQDLLAVGESQSAFTLTTYYDGVQPLTQAFDGFMIHSRGGAAAPLTSPSGYIDIAGSLSGKPTTLRTDQAAPAIVIETETDVLSVLGYYPARQPDADHLRTWEVAGTAHADAIQIGDRESTLGCPTPINRGQQVFVLRAALQHLRDWVVDGTAPPHADPLAIDAAATPPAYVVDGVGNVKGGVRTPVVDAPVDRLSGIAGGNPSVICLLLGSTTPIPAAQLATLYPSSDDYLTKYTAATDDAIAKGFALQDDRAAMLDDAQPSRVG